MIRFQSYLLVLCFCEKQRKDMLMEGGGCSNSAVSRTVISWRGGHSCYSLWVMPGQSYKGLGFSSSPLPPPPRLWVEPLRSRTAFGTPHDLSPKDDTVALVTLQNVPFPGPPQCSVFGTSGSSKLWGYFKRMDSKLHNWPSFPFWIGCWKT